MNAGITATSSQYANANRRSFDAFETSTTADQSVDLQPWPLAWPATAAFLTPALLGIAGAMCISSNPATLWLGCGIGLTAGVLACCVLLRVSSHPVTASNR